ncbi:MAG: hypothetical protein AAGG44_02380 [Planctomycetota bacterium]
MNPFRAGDIFADEREIDALATERKTHNPKNRPTLPYRDKILEHYSSLA